MFSVVSFTVHAASAIRVIPSSVNSMSTSSVFINAMYCSVNDALGSVRMRLKSLLLRASSSTRIGRRPCSSGMRSDGLATWNAPDATNRMWSVFTMPCFVETVLPSIRGSKSRCTPSRDTSGPELSPRLQILSISSMKTIPLFSTLKIAASFSSSWFTSFAASSSASAFIASLIFSLRFFLVSPARFWNIPCSWLVISSIPGGAMISTPI